MASDELIIEVAGSSALAQPTREALEACAAAFAKDVLREAERLEAGLHVGPGAAMITNSMIQEANLLGRRGHIQRRTPMRKHVASAVSYIAATVAGVFAGNLDTPTGSIGFAAALVVGIFSFFYGVLT